MNVHNVNGGGPENHNDYRSLQLLDEIEKGTSFSQRELSSKLNIALGLVNSYLKNLVARGLVKMKAIPPRRYAYYLTPQGFSEKTRLTYTMLRGYTNLFRQARRDFQLLISGLQEQGVRKVHFVGLEQVSEIAYLSLREVGLELESVVDDDHAGESFFGSPVIAVKEIQNPQQDIFVITTIERKEQLCRSLADNDVPAENIHAIGL